MVLQMSPDLWTPWKPKTLESNKSVNQIVVVFSSGDCVMPLANYTATPAGGKHLGSDIHVMLANSFHAMAGMGVFEQRGWA